MLDAEQANRLRDKIEESLAEVMAKAVRRLLARVAKAAGELTADSVLTSAGPPNLTLGQIMGWWTAIVDQALMTKIIDAYSDAVHQHLPDGTQVVATSLDEAAPYFAAVRDRLVQGIVPPLPDDAFNRIRETLAQAAAQGWSRQGLARRIAEELAWEPNKSYWQDELARANARIDSILDPLGPPGSPVREAYRLNDPTIAALQADRRNAIARIEADESYWQTRANRIARTEATGANNYAALRALADEGASHKQWVATEDHRTRETHIAADGQVVPLGQPFMVGGHTLQMPGDPNGPAVEIVNCRCCIIGVHKGPTPEEAAAQKAEQERLAAEEAARQEAEQAAAHQQNALEALEAKWKGKPAPTGPGPEPAKPEPGHPPANAFDSWLNGCKQRYSAFAGAAKGSLEKSNNWHYFQQVMAGDRAQAQQALDFLKTNHYIDAALEKQAHSVYDAYAKLDPKAIVNYRGALYRWRKKGKEYNQALTEWRWINGVTGSQLRGMSGAKVFASVKEGVDYAFKQWLNLTGQTGAADLKRYTGSAYSPWNSWLRSNASKVLPKTGQWVAATKRLDKLFARAEVGEDIYLFRGTRFDEFEFPGGIRTSSIPPPDPKSLIGTVQVQHGFMSTSIGRRAAFSSMPVQIVFRVPQGTKVANAMSVSNFGTGEMEIMVERGAKFFIHDVRKDANGWLVEAEIVPDDFDPHAGHSTAPLTHRVGDRH